MTIFIRYPHDQFFEIFAKDLIKRQSRKGKSILEILIICILFFKLYMVMLLWVYLIETIEIIEKI